VSDLARGAGRLSAIGRAPALRALLIQTGCFLLVFALLRPLAAQAGFELGIAATLLLEGILAAAASYFFGLAAWWWLIQLAFAPGLAALSMLQLPPAVFLLAFLLLCGLFWSTFRTQVPFYPSTPAVWRAVAGLLPQGRPLRCIDIGSGFGGLVLHLARQCPDGEFIGIELAPLPWLASGIRARLRGSRARFLRGDYEALDLGDYDVVFAYLSPAAMPSLWRKAAMEMRAGALLLSYEFPIPDLPPDAVLRPTPRGPALYVWRR
jgi:SAM-dependent methyltransferase